MTFALVSASARPVDPGIKHPAPGAKRFPTQTLAPRVCAR